MLPWKGCRAQAESALHRNCRVINLANQKLPNAYGVSMRAHRLRKFCQILRSRCRYPPYSARSRKSFVTFRQRTRVAVTSSRRYRVVSCTDAVMPLSFLERGRASALSFAASAAFTQAQGVRGHDAPGAGIWAGGEDRRRSGQSNDLAQRQNTCPKSQSQPSNVDFSGLSAQNT